MAEPILMQRDRVRVDEVIEVSRLRPVTEAGVESLLASIRQTGVMKDAIHVRKKKDGRLYLLAGAHRLEAARRLGWDEIEAKVWTEVTDDWARLIEIDDNLAGAEMNALDSAVFLATRKVIYERLHPEAKRGVAGALSRWNDATEPSSVAFATATAEKFGITARQVRKIVAAGSRLGPDELAQLRAAPKAVTLRDLQVIAKIGVATERYDVVALLAEGRAKSAADALKALKSPVEGPDKDPVEEQFLALMKVWARAGVRARRRYVAQAFDALSPLVADEQARRTGSADGEAAE